MSLSRFLEKEEDEKYNPQFDLASWTNMEYSDICISLARAISDYRERYNITQKELAIKLGCKKSYIVRLESAGIDDLSIISLIELWTRLATPDFNFADYFLADVHRKINSNYKQYCARRFG